MFSPATVTSQNGRSLWDTGSASPWSIQESHGVPSLRRLREKGDILPWCSVHVLSRILAAVEQHTLCELRKRYAAARMTTVCYPCLAIPFSADLD